MEAKFTKATLTIQYDGSNEEWHLMDVDGNIFYTCYCEADAKLIAASSEMYALLKRLLDTCGFVHDIAETDALNLLTKINS